METSARNLVIALALPHLSREEDRVDFLAEQAVLGALYLRGPAVARKAIRRMADRLSDPLIIAAAADLIAGISGAYPSLESSILGVAELLSRAAGDLRRHAEPAAATPPTPPTPPAPPSQVPTGGDADLAAPEAARAPEPPAPSDAAATDAPPIYSVVLTLNCCTPRDGLVRAIRDCVVDRGDGAGLPFDEAHAYAETLVQNFRQGEPVVVAKSASRESADIMCRAILRTGARASVIPSVVLAGESAADNAAWHSLMLVDRGVPPWSGLAHAIAKITTPTSEIIVGDHPYVRAAKLIDNFTTPVEIARYESQATAERVRARLAERVGELGARFAVVLSEPPPARPVAPEVPADPPTRRRPCARRSLPRRWARCPSAARTSRVAAVDLSGTPWHSPVP